VLTAVKLLWRPISQTKFADGSAEGGIQSPDKIALEILTAEMYFTFPYVFLCLASTANLVEIEVNHGRVTIKGLAITWTVTHKLRTPATRFNIRRISPCVTHSAPRIYEASGKQIEIQPSQNKSARRQAGPLHSANYLPSPANNMGDLPLAAHPNFRRENRTG
jgi:hypothetical protein